MNNTTSNKWVEIYSPVRVKYKELVLEINDLESVKGNMILKTEDLFLEIHLNAKEKACGQCGNGMIVNNLKDQLDKHVFGIDLGTTNSCIAYVNKTGLPVAIKNSEGDYITPSVVNFESPNQVVVGQIAKEYAVIGPVNTVSLVKAKMGKTNFVINYNGRDITPEEVSAYILRKVTEDAASQIHSEVKDVVITCPAYFGTTERVATKYAGIIAGLNVLGIISEPVAAAIYYGCTEEHEEKTILVYDLGGGTFDVTVMKISSEKIQVICSEGDHDLGGKDWDAALMRYLVSEFNSQIGCSDDFDEVAKQALQLKTETAKKRLTFKDLVPVVIDSAGKVVRVNVSLETFDEITSTLLRSTLDLTDTAISVAQKKYPGLKIDEILLVGGSTRMRQVKKAIIEKYGIQPKILDPDEVVAKGAAIYAMTLSSIKEDPLDLEIYSDSIIIY